MEALTAYFIIRYFNFPALQGELCPRLFSQNRPFSGGRAGTESGPCIKSAKGTPGFLAPFQARNRIKCDYNGNGRNRFPQNSDYIDRLKRGGAFPMKHCRILFVLLALALAACGAGGGVSAEEEPAGTLSAVPALEEAAPE